MSTHDQPSAKQGVTRMCAAATRCVREGAARLELRSGAACDAVGEPAKLPGYVSLPDERWEAEAR